jgi:hypothetical protein
MQQPGPSGSRAQHVYRLRPDPRARKGSWTADSGQVCSAHSRLKTFTSIFSKTAGRTPIFEARIVIYDQIWV